MSHSSGWGRQLSELLEYPDAGLAERVRRLAEAVRAIESTPDSPSLQAARLLDRFYDSIHNLSTEELQELFIRTFDLNPVCALEVGWQLYGEEYARGRFLVFMREQLRRFGVGESRELPDHLTLVLPLLDCMPKEEAAGLAQAAVIPALHKMLNAFARQSSPYQFVLGAAGRLLAARCGCEFLEVIHA